MNTIHSKVLPSRNRPVSGYIYMLPLPDDGESEGWFVHKVNILMTIMNKTSRK